MPTVIALDVSLSMRRLVVGASANENVPNEQLTRHQLAVHGINTILHHLQNHSKLEFVSLIAFSSFYEVVCPFTRDYESIRLKLQSIEECDRTCLKTVLHYINSIVISEWGSATPCQVILITDGNPGVGLMSLNDSLNSSSFLRDTGFSLPFVFPGKLTVVCISNQTDLMNSLPLYQKLVDLAGNDSMLVVPEGQLSISTVTNCFKKLTETNYVPFEGYLKCGHLGSRIIVFPPPIPYTKKADFELLTGLTISRTIEIRGFIPVSDVGSPTAISRHLVLPMLTDKTSSMQGISMEEDSDIEDITDEDKIPSFCVLLHGALKVENMAALCLLNTDWYGFIYSRADTKKKSNLMLTVLEHGADVVPWLSNFRNLGPIDYIIYNKNAEVCSFPIRPSEKRSYSQNAPSWIRQVGLQSDIQKILRHAKKLPEKTQNFYKELNRLRRAALSLGFIELLDGLALIFDRECTMLPSNLNADCAIQMRHCAEMLRKPFSRELKNNITPFRTKFSPNE